MRFLLIAAACAVTAIAFVSVGGARPLIAFNPSHSVRPGFYLRSDDVLRRGSFVTVRAADVAKNYAHLRNFDGPRDRFIKRIAGVPGDLVCANGDTIYLNRQAIVHRLKSDSVGRPLPSWSGCEQLGADRYFLLGDTPDSFDGRYWGPVSRSIIDGAWRHLI